MDPRELLPLNVGPYSHQVRKALETFLATPLLQFRGELRRQYHRIASFDESVRMTRDNHQTGFDWIELTVLEEAYACGGSSYREQEPWRPLESKIDKVLNFIYDYSCGSTPTEYYSCRENVAGNLYSCFECLVYLGKFDDFHAALWEAYIQGGWPCGWLGEVSEREDGSWDISNAKICVFWNPPVHAH